MCEQHNPNKRSFSRTCIDLPRNSTVAPLLTTTRKRHRRNLPFTYVGMIARAILASPERRILLSDIYSYLTRTNAQFASDPSGTWRNCVRYNLSRNKFFIKVGRSERGRGNYWAVHPACVDAFMQGDYTRRTALLRVKVIEESATVSDNQIGQRIPM